MVRGREGRALVFLHGNAENHNFFSYQVAAFRNKYTIVSLDQRGYGLSHRLKPPEKASLTTWTDDVFDVLQELRINEAVLMGHSFGGSVGLNFAIAHPKIAKGVITSGGLSEYRPDIWSPDRPRKKPSNEEPKSAYDPTWDFFPGFAEAEKNRRLISQVTRVYNELDPYSYREGSRAVLRFAITPNLWRIKCPVMILAGDSDRPIPLSHAIVLNECIPRSYLKVFRRVGHNPHIERPELTNALMSDFFRILGW